jgi:hypothetical protein
MTSSSPRLFLVVPLEAEPDQLPENAHIVRADSIETLIRAQEIKDKISDFLSNRRTHIGMLRELLRSK